MIAPDNFNLTEPASQDQSAIQMVAHINAWLTTMRGQDGYGGPVAHWWQNCLHFTGAGIDWRYEGIVLGYINLYQRMGETRWLASARLAADDIIRGQLLTGHFRNSNFEVNPYPGGTPHEAACDLALLSLANVLRLQGDPAWVTYTTVAERNLYLQIERLWDVKQSRFCDEEGSKLFVPNKAATLIEAIFALSAITGSYEMIEQYAHPTLEAILSCQVNAFGNRLHGAIDQSQSGTRATGMYFPLYIARCIPALIQGYNWFGDTSYRDAACLAMAFIVRERYPDGSLPQIVYKNGRVQRYPQWVAGAGDFLRAMDLMNIYDMQIALEPTISWLLSGLTPSGGCRTAYGFKHTRLGASRIPDFLDLLPVCGWVDKAFRWLTSYIPKITALNSPAVGETIQDCIFQGQLARFYENASEISVWQDKKLLYQWHKGDAWAETPVLFG